MRADKSKGKAQGQAKGKKLTVKKSPAVKDLEPTRGVKAGAATRTAPWMRHAGNHNETIARDRTPKPRSR